MMRPRSRTPARREDCVDRAQIAELTGAGTDLASRYLATICVGRRSGGGDQSPRPHGSSQDKQTGLAAAYEHTTARPCHSHRLDAVNRLSDPNERRDPNGIPTLAR